MQNTAADAKSHLINRIEMGEDRAIPFREFMAVCLYDEGFGYYNRDKVKIGKEGDFYTSSSVGPYMGKMLGKSIVRMLRDEGWDDGRWQIVEWGGGNGRLAKNVLDLLQQEAPADYERLSYTVIESSPFHRKLQEETLHTHGNVRFETSEEWLAAPHDIPTIVCSNELLDAFPVHRVRYANGRFEELHVAWDPSVERFTDVYKPIAQPSLLGSIRELGLPEREGQLFELNPGAVTWLQSIASRLRKGAVVTIDYGDTSDELFAAHRMRGTLMCYYRHQAHDNPYMHVGEQDITAHVNFSSLMQAGDAAGLQVVSYETQRAFLVRNGILEQLQPHDGRDPFSPEARSNRAIRQLLLSDQMSELFKVLVQKIKGEPQAEQ